MSAGKHPSFFGGAMYLNTLSSPTGKNLFYDPLTFAGIDLKFNPNSDDFAFPTTRTDAVAQGDKAGPYSIGSFLEFLFAKVISGLHEQERGLILAIVKNNEDPELREVYADWLEEHNRLDEAIAERRAAESLRETK